MHCAAAARRVHGDRLHSVRPPVAVFEPQPSSEASSCGTLITLPATVDLLVDPVKAWSS